MVVVKKTTELTVHDYQLIHDLFVSVFKRERTLEQFKDLYCNTPLGYAFHAMLFEGDELIGFHTGIPFYYRDGEKRFIAGLGIDTMTAEGHRDFFHVRDLFKACEEAMATEGCKLRLGFPNDNSYPILKKGSKYKDIGKLDTYFLPIRVGGVKPSLKVLNPLSRIFAFGLMIASRFSFSRKEYKFKYGKERSSFDSVRYKWFGGLYNTIKVGKIISRYKIQVQENVRTAFLLDVFPLSKYAFDAVVREIYHREKTNVDLIMYVGHLPFSPNSLITMPHKFEPKHFNFTCKPLVNDFFDDSLYDINNWDVNLSNYDLL